FIFNITAVPAIAENTGIKAENPQVAGAAVLLMDLKSGQILFERNPHNQLAIASITKIMTAIVALENGDLDSVVTIGPDILDRKKIYGTLLFLSPGEKFTLRQLLDALLMNSANDAAAAIAESIGGSEDNFIKMMNQKAADLGLSDTHFTNPHGLSEIGHYSSAYDMAIIARYGLQKPVLAEIVKTKYAKFPRSEQGLLPDSLQNQNKLLWQYDGADGVKTGYTDQAGNTIVASATRNDRQLLVVILKGTSGTAVCEDAATLLDYGFEQFHNKLLASKNQVINSVNLENAQILNLSSSADIYGTIKNDQNGQDFQLRAVSRNIKLPVKAGDELGRVDVYFQGKIVQTVPLVAQNSLSKTEYIFYLPLGGVLLSGLIVFKESRRSARRFRSKRIWYRQ
ncbi:MAG TPA: D-alanyl-D-alanine carboxypeptidase family protein, partial [Desulfitobacteriaceae bacterium]|nr:D-alanyl-D-alanine carboxypeptidase family protein [Desulfitobacteriaceae bacterium]